MKHENLERSELVLMALYWKSVRVGDASCYGAIEGRCVLYHVLLLGAPLWIPGSIVSCTGFNCNFRSPVCALAIFARKLTRTRLISTHVAGASADSSRIEDNSLGTKIASGPSLA